MRKFLEKNLQFSKKYEKWPFSMEKYKSCAKKYKLCDNHEKREGVGTYHAVFKNIEKK